LGTIFSQIIEGKIPCEKVFESETIFAFKDINPHAPVHILILPKKEIPSLQEMKPSDYPILGEIVAVAQKLAKDLGIEKGYRLLTNNGTGAGQTIFHLHFHLIGGAPLSESLA